MKDKRVLLAASFMLFALLLLSVQTLAKPAGSEGAALAHLVEDGEVRQIDLGGGRYMAVVPALSDSELNSSYTAYPVYDTWVNSYSSGSTNCGSPSLNVSYDHVSETEVYERSFLGFNLSAIPSNALVSSATLHAYLTYAWGRASHFVGVRRVTSAWTCPSWSSMPSSVSMAGGETVNSTLGWKDWSLQASVVQTYWIGRNFGSGSNHGLELRGTESGLWDYFAARVFSSSSSGNRPYLIVTYSLPTPTPTRTLARSKTPTRTPGTATATPTATASPTPTPTGTLPANADMEVEVRLAAPLGGIAAGDEVEFVITVRNTGDTTLSEILVRDLYQSRDLPIIEEGGNAGPSTTPARSAFPRLCLQFLRAEPAPDSADTIFGALEWSDITTHFGDLPPGAQAEIRAVFLAMQFFGMNPCSLLMNCVTASEPRLQINANWCEDYRVDPEPPQIEVAKWPEDPVVCIGDEVVFRMRITNTGTVDIASIQVTHTYDMDYLSFLEPEYYGPDDGELTDERLGHGFGYPPGEATWGPVKFRARAETASTVNEIRVTADHRPATERRTTASVAISGTAGPCEGNLVANGGFEDSLDNWGAPGGIPRIGNLVHSGSSSLLLGMLPSEGDWSGVDAVLQCVDIPADAHHAVLSFWYHVDNWDPDIGHNWFVARGFGTTRDGDHRDLDDIVRTVDSVGWQQATVDLTPFVGGWVCVHFLAYNDGDGAGPLWAYVDDVEICVSRCGPVVPPSEGGQAPARAPGFCWKASHPDYAPNGMPDFDQGERFADARARADGPAAAANSLWWFDSKFEPGTTPPTAISDGYPLVEAYGAWDDHDVRNVSPLILGLAARAHTDGQPNSSWQWIGTRPDDLANGLRSYLTAKQLLGDYSVTLEQAPAFDRVYDKVRRSDDVLLLLGFWEQQPDGWRRLGGHWVTAAGVDCLEGQRIGLSDPSLNSAEEGYPGASLPVSGHTRGHAPSVHDDAAFVSHDIYNTWERPGPNECALWGLVSYFRPDFDGTGLYPDVNAFWGANTPPQWAAAQASAYQNGPIEVCVEYAIIVSPIQETVFLSLDPRAVAASVDEVFAVDIIAESATQSFDAVEAYVDFDPTYLRCVDAAGNPVTAITPGEPTMIQQNTVDPAAGEVSYAARVPLGSAPITGRVCVATMYFRALAATPAGGSPLEFNWTTPRRSDIFSSVDSVLGDIEETRVTIGTSGGISGTIALQGRPTPPHARWEIPLTMELRDPTTDALLQIFSPRTDNMGRFTIAGVTPGTYDLRVKGMHTLANRWSGLSLTGGPNSVSLGTLREGDADNDNDVDGTDASLLNRAFGTAPGSANWDPRADLNEDGVVNSVDMALLAGSFGQRGDVEVGSPATALWRAALGRSKEPQLAPGHPGPSAFTASEPVTITFVPSPVIAAVGDTVTVDVVLHAGTQPVDTADLYISFPHLYIGSSQGSLHVVDAAGNPANTVQAGTAFDSVLVNSVDTTTGKAHFAATMLGGSLTGDITVATIRFRALSPTSGSWLRFGVWPPEQTTVCYRGESLLTGWPAGRIIVSGGSQLYVPLARR